MTAYYNEFDKPTAAWLRQLISDELIAPGDVDERSIKDVTANDIRHYTQCHFFAGIGGWSLALRLAGWPDDRPVWTGSCPCQPFSAAGKGLGNADERHLWPVFYDLIKECRPEFVFGEQVASAIGKGWLDGISADLEATDYTCGAAVLGAHSVGSPHIRQRLFWVANADEFSGIRVRRHALQPTKSPIACDTDSGVADTENTSSQNQQRANENDGEFDYMEGMGLPRKPRGNRPTGGLGDTAGCRCSQGHSAEQAGQHGQAGYWDSFTTIPCGDGKERRLEPGVAALVTRLPRGVVPSGDPRSPEYAQATAEARVMRLRGYGNAIIPQVAAEFIRAFMDVTEVGQPLNIR